MAKQSDSTKKAPSKTEKPASGGKSTTAPAKGGASKGGDMKKGDAKSGDKKGGKK